MTAYASHRKRADRAVECGPPRPRAHLDSRLPDPLELGSGTALLLRGRIETGGVKFERPRLRLGEIDREVDGFGPSSTVDAGELIWWSLLPIPATAQIPEPARIDLVGEAGGETVEIPLATTGIANGGNGNLPDESVAGGDPSGPPLIAICMATYEPEPAEFERQLASIKEQTWSRWICLISDDHSSEEGFRTVQRAVSGDPRFRLSRAPRRGGFYRNFERALGMVPTEARFVALADQDDRWHPDKLEALSARLAADAGAELAYSDMRIAARDGTIISDTFWYQSINSFDDVATLAVVNTVTGAASLFRRSLLDLALPFPPAFSDQHYHDHWLALCALAVGEISYLDRPTYDYTRHEDSITLQASNHWSAPPRGWLGKARMQVLLLGRRLQMAATPGIWRSVYFDRFLLIRQFVEVLELRAGTRIEPAKRRRLRLVADADRSPRAALFLLGRASRSIIGRRETLGRERVLIGGLLWRWIFAATPRIRASRD